jgi:hypothetical protein
VSEVLERGDILAQFLKVRLAADPHPGLGPLNDAVVVIDRVGGDLVDVPAVSQ